MYEELTAFRRDILHVVRGAENVNGLGIKEELEDYYLTEINNGRIYPNLDELVEMGLIEKRKKNGRTNEYSITEKGLECLDERQEWERGLVPEVASH